LDGRLRSLIKGAEGKVDLLSKFMIKPSGTKERRTLEKNTSGHSGDGYFFHNIHLFLCHPWRSTRWGWMFNWVLKWMWREPAPVVNLLESRSFPPIDTDAEWVRRQELASTRIRGPDRLANADNEGAYADRRYGVAARYQKGSNYQRSGLTNNSGHGIIRYMAKYRRRPCENS
jgi:hypothetical protein